MSRYLQRLVTRSTADVGVSAARPLMSRTSPIANEDQRIGMPGFEDFQFGIGSSAGRELEDTGGATDNPGAYTQPRIRAGKADADTRQGRAAGPAGASGLPTPRPAARLSIDESSPTIKLSFEPRAADRSAARGESPDENVSGPLDQVLDTQPARRPRDSENQIAPNGVRPTRTKANELATSPAPSHARDELPGARHRTSTEVSPQSP